MNGSEPEKTRTTCSYCGVGCGMLAWEDRNGNVRVEGDDDHPANRGMLCTKGKTLDAVVNDTEDRLLYPELRDHRNEPRERVSWDTAIERAAAEYRSEMEENGPDSVGFYVSGQCLTEEYYLANKLSKGFIGTNNIDTNSRLCMSSAVSAYKMTLGEDAVPISYDDIELADCFFITGANPAWCHPILFRRLEEHKKRNPDVRVMVADPRETNTCSIADLHLQLKPGTDVSLNYALGRCLIENGRIDESFIQNHTDGFEAYKQAVMEHTVDEYAQRCDVDASKIRTGAEFIGDAEGFISMWAMGLNQSVVGVNKNLSLINLSLITGQIGQPGSGPFSLTGQPNAMGGREVGGMATLLSAHRDLNDPEDRKEVAERWGVSDVPAEPGYTATEMFEALRDGRMNVVWIICTNPVVSMPDTAMVEEALENAEFVIVQDISRTSETVEFADLVLPAAGWLEKEGTMTNSDRRISYLNKAVDPPGEARPDADILCDFAREMGYDGFDFDSKAEIFDEHCELTRGTSIDITGLSYDELKEKHTVQWPYTEERPEGTARLFTDGQFYTDNQNAKIYAPSVGNPSEVDASEDSLVLTTGRVRDQWHTRTRTGKVNSLNQSCTEPYADLHPEDAASRNVEEGDPVVISNEHGEIRVKAKLSTDIKKGVAFVPIHWGKMLEHDHGRTNNVMDTTVDPNSKEPDYKYTPVQVAPFEKSREKLIVVGAGAAAYRFVNTYRDRNSEDELHVFSMEKHPFYNRVQLPKYMHGKKSWDELQKMREDELDALDLELHQETAVEEIRPEDHRVVDEYGREHAYDRLILATGSRANEPEDLPDLPGIFTIRKRSDADQLKDHVGPDGEVLIVGGGLLGVEVAGAMNELGHDVTVVHRNDRLMNRNLDGTAAEMLGEHVESQGIDVRYNEEVDFLSERSDDEIEARLKSGSTLTSDAVVYAIGTVPNDELAQEASLECNYGVTVDERLRTSHPDVFAIGEVAEFNGHRVGTTPAAEDQADIAAEYICGDTFRYYNGSVPSNVLKFPGIELCSLGTVERSRVEHESELENVVFEDRARGVYKKCIIHNDRLVGALLVGDTAEYPEFKDLIEKGLELGDRRMELLHSSESSEPMKGEQVCSCNHVGDENIREAIENGCEELDELYRETAAGTGCGSCKPEVKDILEEKLEAIQ